MMGEVIEKVDKTSENKRPKNLPVASINDCMAVERTIMANERTLLAYVRTSLAILVVAVTIIKFFTSQGMVILGYSLLLVGVVCMTFGLMRFTEMYNKLKQVGRCTEDFIGGDDDD